MAGSYISIVSYDSLGTLLVGQIERLHGVLERGVDPFIRTAAGHILVEGASVLLDDVRKPTLPQFQLPFF